MITRSTFASASTISLAGVGAKQAASTTNVFLAPARKSEIEMI
jgi:hypothetical protein